MGVMPAPPAIRVTFGTLLGTHWWPRIAAAKSSLSPGFKECKWVLCFPSGYFFTSNSSAPASFVWLIGVYGLATGNHLPSGRETVSTAAAPGSVTVDAKFYEYDLQVNVRPLTSVELGSENRNRLVS